MFHSVLAEVLEIDLAAAGPSYVRGIKPGNSGLVSAYGVPLEIGIQNRFYSTFAYFSPDVASTDPGLLGQWFFNTFTTTLLISHNSVVLQEARGAGKRYKHCPACSSTKEYTFSNFCADCGASLLTE